MESKINYQNLTEDELQQFIADGENGIAAHFELTKRHIQHIKKLFEKIRVLEVRFNKRECPF